MTMQIKTQTELTQTINEHYKNNEIPNIIIKTSLALELSLALGINSLTLTYRMYDLGIKPSELGLAMALAMKRTDDKYLSVTDQDIKKIVLSRHADMIKELETVLE